VTVRGARGAGGPAGAGPGDDQMLLSMKAVSCDLDRAPTLVPTTAPFLNSISVGMPRMPYLAGVDWFSSDVQLGHRDLAAILLGDLNPGSAQSCGTARTIRPVVHEDRGVGLEDVLLEAGVADVLDVAHLSPSGARGSARTQGWRSGDMGAGGTTPVGGVAGSNRV